MRLPATLPLRPSRRLRLALAAMHALAGASVLSLHLPAPARLALVMALAVSLLAILARRESFAALGVTADGQLDVIAKVGAGGTATILPETTVFPGAVVLALRLEGRRHTLVLLSDSFEGDGFRQLRVWLATRARISASE